MSNIKIINSLLGKDKGKGMNVASGDNADATYVVSDSGTIDMTSIDDMVNDGVITEKIGLLHLDTEGHELDCLEGASETIQRDRPIVMVETLNDTEFQNISRFFKSLEGYTCRTIDESCNALNVKSSCRNHLFLP
jgi:hypothetical protein